MKKFIVLYHAPVGAMEKMASATPEEAKKGMEPWMAWAQRCGEGLVDMGLPLGMSMKVTSAGTMPNQTTICGYSVLQANDMDGAVEMLKDHPHVAWMDSCTVEVHEALPMPGQGL